jgi:ATP-binding cassette subfamily F protein uup
MNIINVENITKVYTERELFKKASFYVQEREKIGIVGINGTGKSTLLKIVAGLEEPDEGSVIRANHVVVNFLPQNPEFDATKSVLDNVMEKIITTDMDETRRWSLESEAKSLMYKLGIVDLEQLCGELSGKGPEVGVCVQAPAFPPFLDFGHILLFLLLCKEAPDLEGVFNL